MHSLLSEERETIISWNDSDSKIFIYTTQRKIITKLNRNPQFELEEAGKSGEYNQKPLYLRGFLPLNAITIRRTSKLGQKPKNFDVQRLLKKKTSGSDKK
jgi:hypothetical protein